MRWENFGPFLREDHRQEPSTTPHDIYDRWVAVHGDSLESFFPVADTEIGRIGTIVCYEGSFPETARALAMNGAEVIYRCSYAEPWVGRGAWEIQNRARALDNTCYVIAPNIGPCSLAPEEIAPVDVSALRQFRQVSGIGSWLKELKTEIYSLIYRDPVYP